MIGSEEAVFTEIEHIFAALATDNGYARVGNTGAGHFVKMVHNGIEYGMMGAIAEGMNFVEEHVGLPEGMSREEMTHHAGVPETAMHDFLDGLEERWGGAMGYLRDIGIGDDTFAAVRHNFLD